jgi:hypothetical protein
MKNTMDNYKGQPRLKSDAVPVKILSSHVVHDHNMSTTEPTISPPVEVVVDNLNGL